MFSGGENYATIYAGLHVKSTVRVFESETDKRHM
jgi:hypothetical protein